MKDEFYLTTGPESRMYHRFIYIYIFASSGIIKKVFHIPPLSFIRPGTANYALLFDPPSTSSWNYVAGCDIQFR